MPETSGRAADGLDFADLYERAPCGLLVTTDSGVISYANATFCHWMGFSREDLLGQRKLQELLTMGGRIFHQTHWAPLLQMQGTISEVKLDLVHRDGHSFPVLMNAVRRERGGVMQHEVAVFVAEDRQRYEREFIAARKRAEELLIRERETQRALAATQDELKLQREAAEDRASFAEQMIGIVSHDLRNPLMAINASAAILGLGELSPRQRRATDGIGRAVARSKRLIDDLLDFTQARIGRGLRVSPRITDLHAIAAHTVDELRVAHPSRRIDHSSVGEGSCLVDEDRIAQILGNLVVNAINYGDPRGVISVKTAVETQRVSLQVHNVGAPIPPEQLPTIFSAMTQGEAAGATHSIGLGLFIVHEIAKAHAGSVDVASSAEHGTTFTVTLPTLGTPGSAPAP